MGEDVFFLTLSARGQQNKRGRAPMTRPERFTILTLLLFIKSISADPKVFRKMSLFPEELCRKGEKIMKNLGFLFEGGLTALFPGKD